MDRQNRLPYTERSDLRGHSMRRKRLTFRLRHTLFCVLPALWLSSAGARPALADIIYHFSLAANGSAGAVDIQIDVADFLPPGVEVLSLNRPPITSFSSGTPIDPALSVIGIDVEADHTFFGVDLVDSSFNTVLFTTLFPDDFFVFGLNSNQTGTFLSSAGNVTSDLTLNATTPTGTLVVTDTEAVPEPATAGLLGLGFLAIAGSLHRLRCRTQ